MKGGDDIRILQRKSVVSMNKISSAKRDAEEFERRRATHASEGLCFRNFSILKYKTITTR